MPLTDEGREILANMQREYGEKRGESIFYASINEGKIKGAERSDANTEESPADKINRLVKGIVSNPDEKDVIYADCGLQEDGLNRFPIATIDGEVIPENVTYAWDYISNPVNMGKYNGEDLIAVRKKVEQAAFTANAQKRD